MFYKFFLISFGTYFEVSRKDQTCENVSNFLPPRCPKSSFKPILIIITTFKGPNTFKNQHINLFLEYVLKYYNCGLIKFITTGYIKQRSETLKTFVFGDVFLMYVFLICMSVAIVIFFVLRVCFYDVYVCH